MKFISWILLICISSNVLASASSMQELESSLDEYQYSMTVDWDQNDKAFYKQKTEAFFSKLQELMKDGRVSQSEVMTLIQTKVSDKNVINNMKVQLGDVSSAKSSSELANILKDNSDKFYAKGASWNGDTTMTIAGIAAVVGLLGYLIWYGATHKCVASNREYVCEARSNGIGGITNSCGYQNICTEMVRR
jgi:hypothetical protein